MRFLKSAVGRKIIIAVSGQVMAVFVVFHLLGNPFNPYSIDIPIQGSLRQVVRFLLSLMLVLHVFYGIQITLENHSAKPQSYAVNKNLRSTFAGRNMIWTGILAGIFVIYHLLQFSFAVLGGSFLKGCIVPLIYIAGLTALFFHMYHGIASFFQTMGWNNDRSLTVIEKAGRWLSFLLVAGYIAIIILNRV
ncbi:MAG: succinate dehydrogenase cytochrome b subunit [Deltaproteobacteria bacterium]|nr:succinate dehydrogenase cytochrome b subunit [Deltaproteobacteria bacterium]